MAESVDEDTKKMLTDFLTSYDNEAYFIRCNQERRQRVLWSAVPEEYEPIVELNKTLNQE